MIERIKGYVHERLHEIELPAHEEPGELRTLLLRAPNWNFALYQVNYSRWTGDTAYQQFFADGMLALRAFKFRMTRPTIFYELEEMGVTWWQRDEDVPDLKAY